MPPPQPPDHFDQLSTSWSLLEEAHDPLAQPGRRAEARGRLLLRYEPVARRYLGGALRQAEDPEAVEECFQRFCLRVLEGGFQAVTPERGRFRHYLRAVLSNLVTDYQRERQRRLPALADADPPETFLVSDEEFRAMYREELVTRALRALAEQERQTGGVLYTVLKLKIDRLDWQAPRLAEHLSGQLGRPLTAGWVRKRLFQARERLWELLRQEVWLDLQDPTDERLDEELAELGLLQYRRPEPPPEQTAP
jgi:RNA polymerase sigma factor (sigma-70 family)